MLNFGIFWLLVLNIGRNLIQLFGHTGDSEEKKIDTWFWNFPRLASAGVDLVQ
jgi:hypothetical protein